MRGSFLPKSSNKWVLAFFSVLLAAAPVHAQATKNFYEGKIISYYVGSTAGGGNDITSRHIARHFERYIPGKPRIDIVNKPGAGGLIAMNELYNLRKPDGLSMVSVNPSSLFASAGGDEAIRFQLQKFIWVGQAFDDAQTLLSARRRSTPVSMRSERPTKKASCRKWVRSLSTIRAA